MLPRLAALSLVLLAACQNDVAPYDRQRAAWHAWQAQQEALRRAQEEQARAAVEVAQIREERQRVEAARDAALEQELAAKEPACADGNAGACAELYRLIERSPPGERTAHAKAMLEKGMQQIAAREAAREAEAQRARKEAETIAAAQHRSNAPSGKAATPAPASSEGRVCCCDGTISPTCTYVHRGCCSHHRGVCPCN